MQLQTALSIFAGGPGSGPNAPCPQCGPHDKNRESGEKLKGPKGKQPPEQLGNVGLYHLGPKAPSVATKLYEKYQKKQKEATGALQPFTKHKEVTETGIKEGDKVKFTADHVVTSTGGGKYQFKDGTIAHVVNVLPKVGNQPQLVSVLSQQDQNEGKFGNVGYVKASDLILHEAKYTPSYQPYAKTTPSGNYIPVTDKSGHVVAPAPGQPTLKPVATQNVLMKTKTADGATLTWIKPKGEEEESTKTLQQISKEEHPGKGDFGLIDKVKGIQDRPGYTRYSRIFDTSGMPSHLQQGPGTTVIVDSYVKKGAIKEVKVEENNYTNYGQRTSQLTFSYKTSTGKFSQGAAAAVGMLKSRYGINLSLKKLRASAFCII